MFQNLSENERIVESILRLVYGGLDDCVGLHEASELAHIQAIKSLACPDDLENLQEDFLHILT